MLRSLFFVPLYPWADTVVGDREQLPHLGGLPESTPGWRHCRGDLEFCEFLGNSFPEPPEAPETALRDVPGSGSANLPYERATHACKRQPGRCLVQPASLQKPGPGCSSHLGRAPKARAGAGEDRAPRRAVPSSQGPGRGRRTQRVTGSPGRAGDGAVSLCAAPGLPASSAAPSGSPGGSSLSVLSLLLAPRGWTNALSDSSSP